MHQWISLIVAAALLATTPARAEVSEITVAQQNAIVADIVQEGTDANKSGRSFFRLFRDRAAGGYYSTPEGMKDIGYVGNVPIEKFEVPAEVLKKLGLA